MKLRIVSPVKAVIESATSDEMRYLEAQLTFTNTSIQHQMKRVANNHFWRSRNPESWQAEYDRLKSEVRKTLIFDEEGQKYIRPGSIPYLMGVEVIVQNDIQYPAFKKVAWAKPLPFSLYEYQELSWQKLLQERHGNVELCTGAGKSAVLLKICREAGLKTVVVAPSRSIFGELLEKFEHHLGKAQVGAFGDGKKRLGKRFTIAIGDSLANVKPGTPEWDFFSKTEMMCIDESHTWGADTLEEVCHGVLSFAPYRFFMSGTQTRGDGTEKLLQSIIGKTVHALTTEEAVKGGFICPHEFRIVEVQSSNPNYNAADALEMKRVHFLSNYNICQFVARLVNAEAKLHKRQTLVLVEELGQIAELSKLLEVPFTIAHAEKKKERLLEMGLEKVDTAESVEKFNKAEAMVLVGTSCVATGTNLYPCHNVVNWVGGTSEIRTKQGAVGRAVRKGNSNPWKDRCTPKDKAIIWDFDVSDVDLMRHHLERRFTYYEDSGSAIVRVRRKP